ncbi:branched-chain amino acid ABC transporter permease [Methylobacterium sp. NEAU 140]|uniref:branched-chain amino acid ABC transporter permease n=1 Tax=Methylobacterium sp. NEAU 140 TaxID=3064945 RepID=UPI002734F7D2|nr:branched-chain amino acid ABC transporter permease [Methylobacterium sp. NEAU 140]MDP4023974.1 branched-chain amino acid ABC transporter permease [Methylobacterium sp. NEAU 140]
MNAPVLELLVGGVLLGGLYALMAGGLNLIFGVMRVVNFAHGEFLAIGALVTVSLVAGAQAPYWVALIVVPAGAALAGLVLQTFVIRRLADAPLIMSLLATYAVSTVLVNAAILIWGGGYRGLPGVLSGSVRVAGVDVSVARFTAFLVAIGTSLAVWIFLRSTRTGRAIRSVAQAPELAIISGISVERVRNITFALGSAMAGLAGVLMAPTFASDAQLGSRFLIKAFAVIIVGGMGSYPGAIAAAMLLGILEVFGGYAFGQVIGSALLYLVMLAVLLVRPRGLLGVGARI